MNGVFISAGKLARTYRQRRARLDAAIRAALRLAAIEVDRGQTDNLRGGSESGDYPVPVRSGDLLQGHFFRVLSGSLAIVGNKSGHAVAVHEGEGSSAPYGRRPFLDDAVESVDVTEIMAIRVREALR